MNPQFDLPNYSNMSPQERIDHMKMSNLIRTSAKQRDCQESCRSRMSANHMTGRSIFDRQYPVSRAKTPVAPIVLQNLPILSGAVEGSCASNDCAICKEVLLPKSISSLVRLPCSHVYHPQCITQWLQEHDTCPECRCSMPTLCHFTTPRAQRPPPPPNMTLRPPEFHRTALQQLPLPELHAMYRSWVICTYHHQQLPMALPEDVANDADALISHLAECQVIRLCPEA